MQALITTVQPRVFATLHPNKIVELFALGTASGQTPGRSVPEIVEGFFSFPNFTRLGAAAVVRKAIARGVKEKFWAMYPELRQYAEQTVSTKLLRATFIRS